MRRTSGIRIRETGNLFAAGIGNVEGRELTMTPRHVAMRGETLEGEQKAAGDL
jgi:hypothetical protein